MLPYGLSSPRIFFVPVNFDADRCEFVPVVAAVDEKLQAVAPLVSMVTATDALNEPLEMVKTLVPFVSGRPVVI